MCDMCLFRSVPKGKNPFRRLRIWWYCTYRRLLDSPYTYLDGETASQIHCRWSPASQPCFAIWSCPWEGNQVLLSKRTSGLDALSRECRRKDVISVLGCWFIMRSDTIWVASVWVEGFREGNGCGRLGYYCSYCHVCPYIYWCFARVSIAWCKQEKV